MAALLALGVIAASPALAKVFLTKSQALELAFPDCEIERVTTFLTDPQKERVEALAGTRVRTAIVYRYAASCGGTAAGVAYFDSHRVRTLEETLMVVVDLGGRVARVEMLSFREPEDYIPRDAWYAQFLGRPLDDDMRLKKGIRAVTGATLTARATEGAVRRILALHRVLEANRTGGDNSNPNHSPGGKP